MDSTNSASTSSAAGVVAAQENHQPTSVNVDIETTCWGCGVHLLVIPQAPVYKCGWCGAITNQNASKSDNTYFKWRRFRDRCFVCIVLLFMTFFVCGGIWAIYPIVFSVSYFCGIFHLSTAGLLAICTLSLFCLAAFKTAGAPPMTVWGSYPTVGKGGLENFTFCYYCSKPKSPRAHHCRSCGMCVLDMDHHCPFIGNCVGAANHRNFVLFLISTVTGTFYVAIMSSYAAFHIWPPLDHKPVSLWNGFINTELMFRVLKENILSFLISAVFLSIRGVVLVYLFISSVSLSIGLILLLWQQLCYIYMGQTYLSHLSAESEDMMEKDCQNLVKFFGCPFSATVYLPSYWKSRKSSKMAIGQLFTAKNVKMTDASIFWNSGQCIFCIFSVYRVVWRKSGSQWLRNLDP